MENLENNKNSDVKDVKFEEITPLFSSALASNVSAMRVFALGSNEERRKIVDGAANITNKKEMRKYLKSIL